jgi:hypothetical protein
MENRDRDKMSRNSSSTSAGDINRSTSSNLGKDKSDSNVDFGQKIGRSESWDSEPGRRSGNDTEPMSGVGTGSSGTSPTSGSERGSSSSGSRH